MDRKNAPGEASVTSGEGPPSDSIADPVRAFVGQTLGGYRIRRVIGHGSMGVVFEAEQQSLKRRVALKVLPPSLTLTDKVIQRFLREAESVARINHENIVSIYEIGQDQGVYYYAMQFIDGEPLDRLIARAQLSPKEGARLIAQAARAIHVAHQQGIIHRDVKPSNILVENSGRIVITDFGLARQERSATITESGALVGTPVYMSPEQIRASRDEIDRRTDIYSLGATLYELLCGQPAFSGNTTQEILQRILDREPKGLRKVRPGIAWELEVITLKAMEKDVDRRYQTALAMADDIERYLNGEAILARPSGIFYRSWTRVRKHKEITWLAVAVVVLGLVAIISTWNGSRSKRDSQYRMSLQRGRDSLRRGDYLGALQFYDTAEEVRKGTLEVDEGRAIAACRQALEKESLNASKEAGSIPGDEAAQKAAELAARELQQQFQKAFELLQAAANRGSVDGEVYLGLGETILRVFRTDRLSESLKDVDKAVAMSPESFAVQLGVARYHKDFVVQLEPPREQRIQLLERAFKHASIAISLDKGSVTAFLCRAEIAIERCGKDEAASDIISQYLEMARQDVAAAKRLDPNNALARQLEPKLAAKTMESDWRAKLAELGLPIFSKLVGTQWVSSLGEAASGTIQNTVAAYLGDETSDQKQKRLEDADKTAVRANSLQQAGNLKLALQGYMEAYKLNPQMADYAWRASQLALALKDFEVATEMIGKARRAAPGNALYANTELELARARGDQAKVDEILSFFSRNLLDYGRLFGQGEEASSAGQGHDKH